MKRLHNGNGACVGLFVAALLLSAGGVLSEGSADTPWYSKPQADRGLKTYRAECARCHGDGLLGSESGPPLVGDAFLEAWKGRTVGDLFTLVRETMPQDSPGRLTAKEYADVVSYMLAGNEFPPGATELPADVTLLHKMMLQRLPGRDRQ